MAAFDEDLPRRVWQLAWPVIGEQLLYMAVNMADLLIAGQLPDATAMQAGLGMATFLNWIQSTLLSAAGVGGAALVARAVGAADGVLARAATAQALVLGFAGGLILAVLNVGLGSTLMTAMGLDGPAANFGRQWLLITGPAWMAAGVTLTGAACLRGAGDTRSPLVIMVGVNAINLTLAIALAFGVGPIPAMGATGIAVATLLARVAGGLATLAVLATHRELATTGRPLPYRLDRPLLRRLLAVGLPTFGETALGAVGMLAFYRLISAAAQPSDGSQATAATAAAIAVAAHGLAVRIEGLSYLPGYGFAVAASTLMGQNLGANRADRAGRAVAVAFCLGLAVMVTMGVVFAVAAESLVRLFSADETVIEPAARVLRIAALAQPGQAAAFVFAGALRGAGQTQWPMMVTAIGLLGVRVPLTAALALGAGLGLSGAWMAMAADLTFRGVVMATIFARGGWRASHI